METFKAVLFPIDFSECSGKVFPFAKDITATFSATLHLLFVARDLTYLMTTDVEPFIYLDATNHFAAEGERMMRDFCQRNLADFPSHTTKVVTGDPAKEILQYAQETPVDLIIMSTHGRKGLDRILLGSVADEVLKHASVPVLTINPFRTKMK